MVLSAAARKVAIQVEIIPAAMLDFMGASESFGVRSGIVVGSGNSGGS